MTDIILNGCNGRMGRVITGLVAQRNDCRIVAGIDLKAEKLSDFPVYGNISDVQCGNVIIDFSHPSSLPSLLEYAASERKPAVIATTGLSDSDIDNIKAASAVTPIFFSFNMSLGVNLLTELAVTASKVLGSGFDIEIVEKHHNQKVDAPSGTALMLADSVNGANGGKFEYVYDRHDRHEKRHADEIGIHSVRGGSIVGDHDVIFAGHDEVITLSHTAYSREIFAVGAVNAAVFLNGKAPGLYSMRDLISNK